MKYVKKVIDAAYHEAGHVVALLLTNKRFKYVTIVPKKSKNDYEPGTLGHVKTIPPRKKYQWEILSFYSPPDFDIYFKDNFSTVAGFVAEKIHTGRFNNVGAGGDFKEWVNVSLLDLPDKLNLSYQRFILEYTKEVLTMEINWLRISAIAEALLERKTLNYDQVWDVIREKLTVHISRKISSKKIIG